MAASSTTRHSTRPARRNLARYAREWIIEIEDISAFVAEQREHAHGDYTNLVVPQEASIPILRHYKRIAFLFSHLS